MHCLSVRDLKEKKKSQLNLMRVQVKTFCGENKVCE